MITFHELMEDEAYKKYFLTVPKLPPHIRPRDLPWKLMVLKQGETQWRVKRFGTYTEAFNSLKKIRGQYADLVINCPGYDWQPPIRLVKVRTVVKGKPTIALRAKVWKPQLDADMAQHYWCPYCRRPTKFGYFSTHQAMTRQRVGNIIGPGVDPTMMRCFICGASEALIDLRNPANHQKWDIVNRVKVS